MTVLKGRTRTDIEVSCIIRRPDGTIKSEEHSKESYITAKEMK